MRDVGLRLGVLGLVVVAGFDGGQAGSGARLFRGFRRKMLRRERPCRTGGCRSLVGVLSGWALDFLCRNRDCACLLRAGRMRNRLVFIGFGLSSRAVGRVFFSGSRLVRSIAGATDNFPAVIGLEGTVRELIVLCGNALREGEKSFSVLAAGGSEREGRVRAGLGWGYAGGDLE